jgi:hypothetical protein
MAFLCGIKLEMCVLYFSPNEIFKTTLRSMYFGEMDALNDAYR